MENKGCEIDPSLKPLVIVLYWFSKLLFYFTIWTILFGGRYFGI